VIENGIKAMRSMLMIFRSLTKSLFFLILLSLLAFVYIGLQGAA